MRTSPTVVLFATIFLTVSAAVVRSADTPPKPPELKVLERFVGTWDEEATSKATEQNRNETKTKGITVNEWVLDGRFIQVNNRRQPGDQEFRQLWTYDPQKKTYRGWHFTSLGQAYEWTDQWDEESMTLTGKSMLGNAVRKGKFIDKDTVEWTLVAKDKEGKVILDLQGKQIRRKAPVEKAKDTDLAPPRPEKLKLLDRLVGSWDTTAVSKPAVWTPKEVRTTSKVERKWVLGGRFLEDTSKISDGGQGLSLTTYDPNMKAYRAWWFSSEGHTNSSVGEWDAKAETLSMKANLEDGLTSRASLRFIDKDRHEWKVVIKDGDGKVYFDATWTVTRRKE